MKFFNQNTFTLEKTFKNPKEKLRALGEYFGLLFALKCRILGSDDELREILEFLEYSKFKEHCNKSFF